VEIPGEGVAVLVQAGSRLHAPPSAYTATIGAVEFGESNEFWGYRAA